MTMAQREILSEKEIHALNSSISLGNKPLFSRKYLIFVDLSLPAEKFSPSPVFLAHSMTWSNQVCRANTGCA